MPAITGAFPYNVDELLGGAVRVLYAPIAQAIPAGIHSVIDVVSPYAPKASWVDLGASKEGFSYSRSFETAGYEIQQTSAAILEEVTTIERTIGVNVAEIKQSNLGMMEEADANFGTVVAAAGVSAQKIVTYGAFTDVTQRRVAFISRRNKASGVVTEPGGVTRGAFVMGVGYLCQMTADSVELGQAKGELSAFGLSFKMFPASGQPAGKEYGGWWTENTPQTIT